MWEKNPQLSSMTSATVLNQYDKLASNNFYLKIVLTNSFQFDLCISLSKTTTIVLF